MDDIVRAVLDILPAEADTSSVESSKRALRSLASSLERTWREAKKHEEPRRAFRDAILQLKRVTEDPFLDFITRSSAWENLLASVDAQPESSAWENARAGVDAQPESSASPGSMATASPTIYHQGPTQTAAVDATELALKQLAAIWQELREIRAKVDTVAASQVTKSQVNRWTCQTSPNTFGDVPLSDEEMDLLAKGPQTPQQAE